MHLIECALADATLGETVMREVFGVYEEPYQRQLDRLGRLRRERDNERIARRLMPKRE